MLIDISPPITESLAVWPGDEGPRRIMKCRLEDGATVTLSTLHTTVHTGAHADGHNHFAIGAPSVDLLPLDAFIGECQVVTAKVGRSTRIRPVDLAKGVTSPRVLLHTGTYPNPRTFNTDFAAIAPELVDALAAKGVRLIGIDAPSVDLFDSKDLAAHHAFRRHGIVMLEGLVLDNVPDGVYEIIALPLRLVGFDGSPVRAVLRSLR